MTNWRTELDKTNACPQRQDSLNDQLKDLIIIANKFGFYDAADFIKSKTVTEDAFIEYANEFFSKNITK